MLNKQSTIAMQYTPTNPTVRNNIPDRPVPIGRLKAIVAFTKPTLMVLFLSCIEKIKDYYVHRLLIRCDQDNVILRCRELCQQFMVDMYVKIESDQ
jgi:hypothetical protein